MGHLLEYNQYHSFFLNPPFLNDSTKQRKILGIEKGAKIIKQPKTKYTNHFGILQSNKATVVRAFTAAFINIIIKHLYNYHIKVSPGHWKTL